MCQQRVFLKRPFKGRVFLRRKRNKRPVKDAYVFCFQRLLPRRVEEFFL